MPAKPVPGCQVPQEASADSERNNAIPVMELHSAGQASLDQA